MEPDDIPRDKLRARTTNRHLIGRDTEGRGHYYSTHLGIVWVCERDRTIAHAYETRDLAQWRDYVAERCGWDFHLIGEDTDATDLGNSLARCA